MKHLACYVLFFAAFTAVAQSRVNGKVVDEREEEVGFCHVHNISLGLGKVADMHGRFSLIANKGDTIRFSYVGFQPLEVVIQPAHLVNFIKVTLPEDTIELPSITIYADPNYRVPLNYKGEPMVLPGFAPDNEKEPIRAGSIRPGVSAGPGGIPGAGATIYGPITYFSKDEREQRKAEEAREETRQTITYQKFIAQDSVREKLCTMYRLDSTQYDQVIVRLNQQFPGIQRAYRPEVIWNWLLSHFDRTVPVIRDF